MPTVPNTTNTTAYEISVDGDSRATIPFETEGDTLRYVDAVGPGAEHTYCVTALGPGSTSSEVCDTGFAGNLPAPTNVAATDNTFDDRVRVTWDVPEIDGAPADNDGYIITRENTDEFGTILIVLDTVGAGVTSFADYDAEAGVTYTYGVASYTEQGSESDPVEDEGTRAAVVGPTAFDASDGDFEAHVALAWENASTTVLLFKVYRDGVLVATVPEWQFAYEDEAVASDVTYSYGVSAVTFVSGGEALREELRPIFVEAERTAARLMQAFEADPSVGRPANPYADPALIARVEKLIEQSASVLGVVESETTSNDGFRSLNPPTGVDATLGVDEEEAFVRVTWTDDSAAEDSFRVYRRPVSEPPANDLFLGSTGRNRELYLDETGESGVRYVYSVRTADSRGPGGESAPGTAEGRRTLFAPSNLQATDTEFEDQVVLTWEDNSRVEDGYRIFRDGIEIGTAPDQAQSFTDDFAMTSGMFGSGYTYEVRAYDTYGQSLPASDEGGTVLLPPGSLSASTEYTNQIVLAWVDQSERETGYRIFRDGIEVASNLPPGTTSRTFSENSGYVTREFCVETRSGTIVSERVCKTGSTLAQPLPYDGDIVEISEPLGTPADFGLEASRFGTHVDVDGDYAIATNNLGAAEESRVFVYKRNGQEWVLDTELLPPDAYTFITFGTQVAIEGNWAFVSDWSYEQQAGQSTGAIAAYKRVGDDWVFKDLLVGQGGNVYGLALAPEGNVLATSGTNASDVDYVQLWRRTGDDWVLVSGVSAPIAADPFGFELAIDGLNLLVSGRQEGWLYSYDATSLGLTRRARLATSGTGNKYVALHGGAAFVSDGVVNVYEGEGDTWGVNCTGTGPSRTCQRQQFLQIFQTTPSALAVLDDLLLIGSFNGVRDPSDPANDRTGSVYAFHRGPDEWTFTGSIVPSAGQAGGDNDNGAFGTSLALTPNVALIGAPGEESDIGNVYALRLPAAPTAVTASDGTYADRVQVRWEDQAAHEDGFKIYRKDGDEAFAEVGEVGANTQVYNDFDAPPGGLYTYRVEAFISALNAQSERLGESTPGEALGWLPADGAISGRIAAEAGAGIEDVEICLAPSPNQALLLDGEGGRTERYETQFPSDAFTIEFWVRGTGTAGLFSYATESAGDNSVLLFSDATKTDFYVNGTRLANVPARVMDGAWHHLSVSWNSGDGAYAFYVDGAPVAGGSGTGHASGEIIPSGGVLMLGQEQDAFGGGLDPDQALDGVIDEVRVWNRVRTAAEIAADYRMPLRGDEPGLASYWPLDQGTGRAGLDPTDGAQHVALVEGAHWAETGAPITTCATTDGEGNFTLDRIRYGEGQAFQLIPDLEGHTFSPAFKTVTLNGQSPVQNEVTFADVTAFTIAGVVEYPYGGASGTAVCPAEGIELYVDDALAGATEADGTFALAVNPSDTPVEFEARRSGHYFEPASQSFIVDADMFGVDFQDLTTYTFSGFAGGTCNAEVGTLTVRVFTENGCFDETFEVSSNFEFDLPPQEYLVEVVNVVLAEGSVLSRVDVLDFYDGLGTRALDLTEGGATLDFVYRAPMQVSVAGLPDPLTCGLDVPVLNAESGSGVTYPLTLTVEEVYSPDFTCPVDTGSVTVYDEWSDREGTPVILEVQDGQAQYEVFPGAPYVLEGRIVEGVDRSYQKALTLVAEAEGRSATRTEWAILEGTRARTGTFVTEPSAPIPMWILHDPPGDNSYSYIEENSTFCKGAKFDEAVMVSVEGGQETELGVQFAKGTAAGVFFASTTLVETTVNFSASVGVGGIFSEGYTACLNTTETFQTSSAPEFVGPQADVFVGMGINYLFAEADQLTVNPATCEVQLKDVLGTGIDGQDPINTVYNYTRGHIENQLLPQLEELAQLYVNDPDQLNTVTNAYSVWRDIVVYDSTLQADEVEVDRNHSFSAGAPVTYAVTYDMTEFSENGVQETQEFVLGGGFGGNDSGNGVTITLSGTESFTASQVFPESEGESTTYGYVLDDDDVGDFFTVDVGSAVTEAATEGDPAPPVFHPGGQMIFDLVAGTSSGPWEEGTQARDNPVLAVNPSEIADPVPLGEAALFTLTLGNDSESQEDREYVLAALPSTNPDGASIVLGSSSTDQTFFIQAGEAISIPMQVTPGPTAYEYEGLGVTLYAAGDYEIWQNGGLPPRADTIYVDVSFSSGCSPIDLTIAGLTGQTWTVNRANADEPLDILLSGFSTDSTDTGIRPTTIGLAYRPVFNPGRSEGDQESNLSLADHARADSEVRADALTVYSGTGTASMSVQRSAVPGIGAASMGFVAAADPQTEMGAGAENGGAAGRDGWIDVPGWGLSSLEGWTDAPFREYSEPWVFPAEDGTYEIAGVIKCSNSFNELVDETFSESITGQVDTRRPRVLGTPAPADGLLTPGDDLAITFDEAMAPASFVASGAATHTVTLQPVNADDSLGDAIPVALTTNGATLVIEPASGWDNYAGLFEAAVDGVEDLLGNPLNAQPALSDEIADDRRAWRFTVRQGFAWAADSLALTVSAGAVSTFEAALVNGSQTTASFAFDTLPDWLEASVSSGTIPADQTQTVTFTVTAPIEPGLYEADVTATSEAGNAVLPFALTVEDAACAPPQWGVNPAAFAYSMTTTATVYLGEETAPTSQEGVRVAAFVGGELRGVSPATRDEGLTDVLAYLSIYSNVEAGDPLSFRVFDPATCTVADSYTLSEDDAPVLTFEADRTVGSPSQPAEFRPAGVNLVVPLVGGTEPGTKGYTWFSTNREGPTDVNTVLEDIGSVDTDIITSRTSGFAQYTPGIGWFGSLEEIVPGEAYYIALDADALLTFSGSPVSAATPIPVGVGWNWIGYYPSVPLTVTEALGGFAATADDIIKGQSGFAQFLPGIGWLGTLSELEAGKGYRLRAAASGTIIYPAGGAARLALLAGGTGDEEAEFAGPRLVTATSETPGIASETHQASRDGACAFGVATRAYPHSMVVTATMASDEWGTSLPDRSSKLVFNVTDADGVCRGQGELGYIDALDQAVAFVMVHGYEHEERLRLEVYDPKTGLTYGDSRLEVQPWAEFDAVGATRDHLVSGEAQPTSAQMARGSSEGQAQVLGRSAPASPATLQARPVALAGIASPTLAADGMSGAGTDRGAQGAGAVSMDSAVPVASPNPTLAASDAPAHATTFVFRPDAVLGTLSRPVVITLGLEGASTAGRNGEEASRGTNDDLAEAAESDTDGEPNPENTDEPESEAGSDDDAEGDTQDDTKPGEGDVTEAGPVATAGAVPTTFSLEAAYPNPFSQSTTLTYTLPEVAPVYLGVYDLLGREVAVLVKTDQAAGRYTVRFEPGSLPSGVYVIVFRGGTFSQSRQMLLTR